MRLSGKIQAFKDMRKDQRQERLVAKGAIYHPGRSSQASGPRHAAPIFKQDERGRIVQGMKARLYEGAPTVFANEGALVSGLRSALCLKGYSYQRSDVEAKAVVSAALMQIGVPRPTFEEAQREFTIPHEYCSWCHGHIPDELQVGNHNKRFCSITCARSAQLWRTRDDDAKYNDNYRSAAAAIARMKLPAVRCRQCDKKFHPEHLGRDLCSPECSAAASRIYQDRACDQCGGLFHPKTAESRFCSTACSGAAQTAKITRSCEQCGTHFETVQSVIEKGKGKFCSTECSATNRVANTAYHRECRVCGEHFVSAQIRARCCSRECTNFRLRIKGGDMPKKLSSKAFDYFLTVPINASRPVWLTPERFDELVAA